LSFVLATGIHNSRTVNIVSRSAGNDLHGSGYFFFQDHNMAALLGGRKALWAAVVGCKEALGLVRN
jgi:hypothetical protein